MLKKLILSTAVLSALLLNGCGGGSKQKTKTQEITERDGVLIFHGTNESMCSIMANSFKKNNEVKDIISDSPANTVSCNTYGKVEGVNCENDTLANAMDTVEGDQDIEAFEDPSKACVIGINQNI